MVLLITLLILITNYIIVAKMNEGIKITYFVGLTVILILFGLSKLL